MKYCNKCGAQLAEGLNNCPNCGIEVVVQPTSAPTTQPITPVQQSPVAVQSSSTPIQTAPVTQVQDQPASSVVQQPVYTQPVIQPIVPTAAPTKSGGMPIILTIILILVAAGGGLLFGKILFEGPSKSADTEVNTTKEEETEKPEKAEAEVVQISAEEKAYIGGYEITIPKNYNFEVDEEDVLYIYDDSQEWIGEVMLTQFSYSNISTNISTLVNNFESSGTIVDGYEEKVIAGKDLVEFKLVDTSGIKIIAAYVKIDDYYIGVTSVYNQATGEYETEKYKKIIEIIATAERSTTDRNIETNKTNSLINVLPKA